jgi:hypothetical protein
LECQFLSKRINLDEPFEDFDIIPAFRFLLWKIKEVSVYEELQGLCSNLEEKVLTDTILHGVAREY